MDPLDASLSRVMQCSSAILRNTTRLQSLTVSLFVIAATGCASPHLATSAHSQLRVEAQIISAAGLPHGGRFALLGRETRRVLAGGRTDAMGRIRAVVTADGRDSTFVLLVQSCGMIGNAFDEWRGNVVPRWPYSDAPLPEIVADARSQCTIAQIWTDDPLAILDDLEGDGHGHMRTAFGCGADHNEVLDTVAKTLPRGRSGVLSFGEVRFPWVHAAAEIALTLEDEHGKEVLEPVVLGGFEGFPESPGKNKVYPHMALAQRGGRIRILLSRAAATLLFADPDGFLVLRSVVGREFESLAVALPSTARREIEGYPWRLALRVKITENNKRPGDVLRPAPQRPTLWWFLEQQLRW